MIIIENLVVSYDKRQNIINSLNLVLSDNTINGIVGLNGAGKTTLLNSIYGLKSIWLVWLWPVFNQVFLFSYLAVWLRRSNASTGAEWMLTRFGKGADAQRSHKIIVAFALTIVSFLTNQAQGFQGMAVYETKTSTADFKKRF